MANTKERLDDLEAGLGMVQDKLQKLSTGINDKFRGMEQSFNRTVDESLQHMMEMVMQGRESGSSATCGNQGPDPSIQRGGQTNPFDPAPTLANLHHVKIELPRFSGGDLTEWITKAKQYFEYHELPAEQRVSFGSYHLTVEANEWWQALKKARGLTAQQIPWETFETMYGPVDGETFDEAMCHIRQKG